MKTDLQNNLIELTKKEITDCEKKLYALNRLLSLYTNDYLKVDNIVKRSNAGRKAKYDFRGMKVGDRIVLSNSYSRYDHAKYGNYARNFARKSPDCKHYKFSTIREGDKIITIRIA